jgi:hypothetical protein
LTNLTITCRRFGFGSYALVLSGVCVASCGSDDSRYVSPGGGGEAASGASAGGQADSNAGETSADAGRGGEGHTGLAGAGAETSPPGAAGALGDAGAAGAAGAGSSDCDDTQGSQLSLSFDSANPERVTHLQWIDSTGKPTANLAAQGGDPVCDDPLEFFGQAYGAEATLPAPVVSGNLGTLVSCGLVTTITSAALDCRSAAQVPVTTEYRSYRGSRANQLRVTRRFGFSSNTAAYPQTVLRAHVPRVPLATFSSVIYPNQAGTAVTAATPGACPADCLVETGADWNGRWFADVDPTSGLALIVLRDPALTTPVKLAVNNDALSASNISSFMLEAPQGGWVEPLTEIQYLCFADSVSWPQSQRDNAELPAGCGP